MDEGNGFQGRPFGRTEKLSLSIVPCYVLNDHVIKPFLDHSDLLSEVLVPFADTRQDHGKMEEKEKEEKDGKEKQERRRIINPEATSNEMQQPAPHRKDYQQRRGGEPDKAIPLFQAVAAYEFYDGHKDRPTDSDSDDLNNIHGIPAILIYALQ
jgi:hypothetical protein